MDFAEYIQNLSTVSQRIEQMSLEAIVIPAANRMLGSIINRNSLDGKNTDGSTRTGYSTKPIYAQRGIFVKKSAFEGRGKRDNADREYKTMYLERGYEELRDIQGMDTKVINYTYSGDTIKAFKLQPAQGVVVIGFTNELAAKIRKGLEAKRGAAFAPSKEEKEEYREEVTYFTKENIIPLMNGTL